MENETGQMAVKQAIAAWQIQNKQLDELLLQLSDEDLRKEIAPGKNTGVYILGHLIAVNDGMITLFNLGERLFKHYDEPFVYKPDKSGLEFPPLGTLKNNWNTLKQALNDKFNALSNEDWFKRHTAVSPEDFLKNPMRNKLNVLMNRTNHQAYHVGQMVLLK